MTSDGWRPIVGSRRQPPGFEMDMRIPQYKNPSQNVEVETFKSENPITITSTAEPEEHAETESATKPLNNFNAGPAQSQNQGSKVSPNGKFSSMKYQTLPPNAVTLGRPSQYGFRKHPLPAKPIKAVTHLGPAPKRKPLPRGPVTAHSTRNEVFIHPSASMSYPYIKQGPSNIRTRETQGLGLFGSQNHFTVNQPNSHVEINRFPSSNDHVFEQYKSPGVTFLVPKIKNGQQDEFSRNLVPPPPSRNLAAEKEKLKNSKIPKFKDNTAIVSEPVLEIHENFGGKTPQIQENLVQASINYDQNFVIPKQFKIKHPQVDVQVTKENLKVFHNIFPNRFKTNGPDYIDYDYHTVPTPGQLPKLQTYEVTEGKWHDSPNPYTFNYIKPQASQNIHSVRQQPIGPQITNEPIVELNLPQFLPTPFRPDAAFPTSPTQSEASTVFSQVSKKMNKFKNAVLSHNPLFFDIKEVSTHYPILGRPSFIQEEQTENPVKENEIVNEVTTQREESTTKKRRRRPQPRRPTSPPTTTTTTEEPQPIEIYEPVKNQEDVSPETEKPPPKRLRQRPNRYRLPSASSSINQEIQEGSVQYRTTTPSTEYEENSGEKRIRGRNRYRQRGSGNKDQGDFRNSLYRKRTRPTTTEVPFIQEIIEKENVEPAENDGFESKYFQNSDLDTTTKPQRMSDYEENSMSEEDKSENVYESTPSANFIEGVLVKGVRTTVLPEETTLFNVRNPQNEIESSTSHSRAQDDQEQVIETTLATTIPTTTTTEFRATTRASRIKTRPTNFKTSNRPRFSVKDYRQRLNQYASTTAASTTTDIVKTTAEGSRLRFPARLRSRPTHSSTTTPAPPQEETTTEVVLRRRFKPKDPRHTVTTESPNIIRETNVKSVNTRLRPFDRYKTSTEPNNVKSKISIKPSFYLNRRRPQITMRTKLNEKENLTAESVTAKEKQDEDKEDAELTTEYQYVKISTTDIPPLTTLDTSEDDYSQRVSDLTSSFKSEYETPGLFKNVAPVSRRVPNYFTISTEDPILPIEAFFPGINEKDKDT